MEPVCTTLKASPVKYVTWLIVAMRTAWVPTILSKRLRTWIVTMFSNKTALTTVRTNPINMVTLFVVYTMTSAELSTIHPKVTGSTFFVTATVSISRIASPVTVSSLLVTCKVIQTVTTTAVDTVITIGTIFTLYSRLWGKWRQICTLRIEWMNVGHFKLFETQKLDTPYCFFLREMTY